MLETVIRSTSRWVSPHDAQALTAAKTDEFPSVQFDTTPSGRIVNRFSRDIETVDSSLSQSLRVVVAYFFALVGAFIVVTAITPAFFLPAFFLAAAYYFLSLQYLREFTLSTVLPSHYDG